MSQQSKLWSEQKAQEEEAARVAAEEQVLLIIYNSFSMTHTLWLWLIDYDS